jgi:hypothetical protein
MKLKTQGEIESSDKTVVMKKQTAKLAYRDFILEKQS